MIFKDSKSRNIFTTVGRIRISRTRFFNKTSQEYICPLDKELDINKSQVTKSLAKNLSLINIFSPFEHGQKIVKDLLRFDIPKRILQTVSYNIGTQLTDYFQEDMTPEEKILLFEKQPVDVQYFLTDGGQTPLLEKIDEKAVKKPEKSGKTDKKQAKTPPKNEKNYREAKIGLFFNNKNITKTWTKNQTERTEIKNKRFVVSLFHGLDHFEKAVRKASLIVGASQAKIIVFLSDGAEWCKTIQKRVFPNSVRILDYYHAMEHLWGGAKKFFGESANVEFSMWVKPLEGLLWNGEINLVLEMIMDTIKSTTKKQDALFDLYNYFSSNKDAMKYKEFRENGYFIGSGSIESAVKYIMTTRFKMTGCHWRRDNAEALMWLRAKYFEGRWDEFWEKMNYRNFMKGSDIYELAA